MLQGEGKTGRGKTTDLVEGAVLVVLGERVLLQEVVLQEARRLQDDLVPLRQRVLKVQSDRVSPDAGGVCSSPTGKNGAWHAMALLNHVQMKCQE